MNKQKIIHIGYPLTITTFLNKFLLDVFNDDFHIHDDLIIENIVNQDINFCDYSGLVKKKIQNKKMKKMSLLNLKRKETTTILHSACLCLFDKHCTVDQICWLCLCYCYTPLESLF